MTDLNATHHTLPNPD